MKEKDEKGGLWCGADRENITPPEELLGNLRGLMDTQFGGIVDELYVRAVALKSGGKQMLLISFDLDKAPHPEENLRLLEAETGVEQDCILLISIHTHSAPVTGYRPYEGPNYIARKPKEVQEATREYEKLLQRKMLEAAKKALGEMMPATCGYGYGESFVNVSRIGFYEVADSQGNTWMQLGTGTNFKREADRTLFVMRFVTYEGKPIAFFINYPVHNTVMIRNGCGKGGKVGISADLGGNVSKYMEEWQEGCVAIWSSGAAGDLNPVMSNQVYRENLKTGEPEEYYETEGAIPLSMLKTLTAHHLADVQKTARKIQNLEQPVALSGRIKWVTVPGEDEEGVQVPYKVRVHSLSIGPVDLVGLNGELYSGLGRRIRERLMEKGTSGERKLVFINHDASLLYNTGYIYGDDIFALGSSYPGEIVGMNHTWMRPGYIEKALADCIGELLADKGGKGR